jgi:uncharacterized protein
LHRISSLSIVGIKIDSHLTDRGRGKGINMATKYKQLNPSKQWEEGKSKTVTFVVTQDCQLRCKYCYVVGKGGKQRMDFEVARKTIDYLLKDRTVSDTQSVIFEFIGGEPLLEVGLIDRICDHFKATAFKLGHPWFDSYRLNITTNGILYDDAEVQKFILKNKKHVHVGISIDGTKEKHDLQRIYPDGNGCYDDVIKNLPLWQKQFPDTATKATISTEGIHYIKESVLHIWKLGIKEVNMNVVFENVWQEGDDLRFENQLMELADHILDKKLYIDHHCSLFREQMGRAMDPVCENQNWCGAGKMLAIDHRGYFYPCLRFTPGCLRTKKPIVIGNCTDGIDQNKLRAFLSLNRTTQSSDNCIKCEVADGCAWCQGENYDAADTDTIFQRATAICKMHKARVRANRYFWSKLRAKIGTSENVEVAQCN